MRRRHRRNHARSGRGYSRNIGRYFSRRRSGWGMNLYRNTREGKIAGVAAGLADHWDIAHWVVRLMWIGACLFTGPLAIWAYIGAWCLLAPRSSRRRIEAEPSYDDDYPDYEVAMEYDERRHDYRPKNVFRYSESGSVRLKRARERLDAALSRVEDMESYVTSKRYSLNKEFSKL